MDKQNILIFGDSNTWGLIPGSMLRYSKQIRYGGIIEKILGDKFDIIEEGLVGRTTIYDDRRYGRRGDIVLPILLESHKPDIVVLMLGTNDIKKYNARTQYELSIGVKHLISIIKKNTNAKILLVSPIALAKNIKDLDSEFDDVSYDLSINFSKTYKDISDEYDTLYLNAQDYAYPSIDGEHMDELSHKRLGEAISNLILSNI